jgi:ubiquitin-conjugating enzyme E2 Q
MSLGFGPSIEHEIITQPYVVDLLIGFCYAAAKAFRIRDYPTGMSLSVPSLRRVSDTNDPLYQYMPYSAPEPSPTLLPQGTTIEDSKVSCKGKYDSTTLEFLVQEGSSIKIRRGDWVVLYIEGMRSLLLLCPHALKARVYSMTNLV